MTDAPVGKANRVAEAADPGRMQRFLASDFFYSFRRSPVAVISFGVTVILILGALLAPLIAPYDPFNPASLNLMNGFTPPGVPNQFTRGGMSSRRSSTGCGSLSSSASRRCSSP